MMGRNTPFDPSVDYSDRKASSQDDRALMCAAHGCPNRWSVQRESGRGMCSAHAWVEDTHLWPRITQEQLDAAADRARYRDAMADRPPPTSALPLADKIEILRRIGRVGCADPHAWAKALQARLRAGEALSRVQRDCLQAYERFIGARGGSTPIADDYTTAMTDTRDRQYLAAEMTRRYQAQHPDPPGLDRPPIRGTP